VEEIPVADLFTPELLTRLAAGEEVGGDDLAGTATGFDGHAIGLVWDSLSWDRVTAHLVCGPQHHQPFGLVHGGVWCSVVETMASIAGALRVLADGQVTVGVSNTTDFLRSHREGRVDGVATPLHIGRSQHLWEVSLTRASDGKAVAHGQVRLQVIAADGAGGGA
jgi:1,4-dihydroxy-2-naphthoyl-CoA hydrolase